MRCSLCKWCAAQAWLCRRCSPAASVMARRNELISSFWLWPMWELHPYGIGTAVGALLRLIRGVLLKMAGVRTGCTHAAPLVELCRRDASLPLFTLARINMAVQGQRRNQRHIPIRHLRDAATLALTPLVGVNTQYCLSWRAAARSDGGLHARDSCGIAFALLHTQQSVDAKPHRTHNERRPASSRRPGGSCPSPTASS